MSRKILLMGRSGSGKTSMRSVIFHNRIATDTRRLGATINTETTELTFMADMKLDLWDCGGQESFMDNYLSTQRDHIFRGVHTLIYIFDVESPQFGTTDIHYFDDCLAALKASSGGSDKATPFVHVLIHKLDLIPVPDIASTLARRSAEIKRKCHNADGVQMHVYGTSIYNETLYKAWSAIIATFIPNVDSLRQHLRRFADICNAAEVVLFEERTLLVISRATSSGQDDVATWDGARFEKVSSLIKIFRQSCVRIAASANTIGKFTSMQIANPGYAAVLDILTPNTYIMVISTEPGVQPAGILHNIKQSRDHFKKLQAATWGATL